MTNALTPVASNVADTLLSLTSEPKTDAGSAVIGFIEELIEAVDAKGITLRLSDLMDELSLYAKVCEKKCASPS